MSTPFVVPDEVAHDVIGRESLWYEYATGVDRPALPDWLVDSPARMAEHSAPFPPGLVRPDRRDPLPLGTFDLLDAAGYPHGRASGAVADPVGHALVTAFAPQWYDLDNPYNPHRGYASGRSLYPVQAFLADGGRWRLLEPDRHSLTALTAEPPAGAARRLVLTGRYARILRGYRWFRGSLVNIELGITLRALAVALDRFGVPGLLALPDADGPALLAGLGLHPTGEWSLPLTVHLDPAGRAAAPRPAADETPPDAVIADLVRVNRAQRYADPLSPLGSGVPAGAAPATDGLSWSELMWRRNSGRVPRGLLGFAVRRRRLGAEVLRDAARWSCLPPPSPTLAAIAGRMTLSVAVQDVDGYADGVYRVGADGTLDLVTADPDIAERLERVYGYPRSPASGCDVRLASMVWFWSVRPRDVHTEFGPAAWTATQYNVGWAVHGLGLAATAAGLFARPVRAFDEEPTRELLRLGRDEMIALAAIVGAPRHAGGGLLDIRL